MDPHNTQTQGFNPTQSASQATAAGLVQGVNAAMNAAQGHPQTVGQPNFQQQGFVPQVFPQMMGVAPQPFPQMGAIPQPFPQMGAVPQGYPQMGAMPGYGMGFQTFGVNLVSPLIERFALPASTSSCVSMFGRGIFIVKKLSTIYR